VANAHLLSAPSLDFVKQAQAYFLLRGLSTFIEKEGKGEYQTPVIICGDFNSRPSSSVSSLFHGDQNIEQPGPDNRWSLDRVEPEVLYEHYHFY